MFNSDYFIVHKFLNRTNDQLEIGLRFPYQCTVIVKICIYMEPEELYFNFNKS